MSLQAPYDTSYSPPAPVVSVIFLSPTNPSLNLVANALVDTGADITVIPNWLPSRLQLIPMGDAFVVGIGGVPSRLIIYDLHLAIGHLRI